MSIHCVRPVILMMELYVLIALLMPLSLLPQEVVNVTLDLKGVEMFVLRFVIQSAVAAVLMMVLSVKTV